MRRIAFALMLSLSVYGVAACGSESNEAETLASQDPFAESSDTSHDSKSTSDAKKLDTVQENGKEYLVVPSDYGGGFGYGEFIAREEIGGMEWVDIEKNELRTVEPESIELAENQKLSWASYRNAIIDGQPYGVYFAGLFTPSVDLEKEKFENKVFVFSLEDGKLSKEIPIGENSAFSRLPKVLVDGDTIFVASGTSEKGELPKAYSLNLKNGQAKAMAQKSEHSEVACANCLEDIESVDGDLYYFATFGGNILTQSSVIIHAETGKMFSVGRGYVASGDQLRRVGNSLISVPTSEGFAAALFSPGKEPRELKKAYPSADSSYSRDWGDLDSSTVVGKYLSQNFGNHRLVLDTESGDVVFEKTAEDLEGVNMGQVTALDGFVYTTSNGKGYKIDIASGETSDEVPVIIPRASYYGGPGVEDVIVGLSVEKESRQVANELSYFVAR